MVKRGIKAASLTCVGLAALALAGGCTYPGDTSGFKPEKKLSKEQINQQIEQVKANPNMPAGVKDMALKKLQKDLETAQ
jgi:hypothetical protein